MYSNNKVLTEIKYMKPLEDNHLKALILNPHKYRKQTIIHKEEIEE